MADTLPDRYASGHLEYSSASGRRPPSPEAASHSAASHPDGEGAEGFLLRWDPQVPGECGEEGLVEAGDEAGQGVVAESLGIGVLVAVAADRIGDQLVGSIVQCAEQDFGGDAEAAAEAGSHGEGRLRDGALELLRGRQRPRQTTDLYAAASRLCGLSAHVCLDLGDYDSAATHARAARACAEAAVHEGLLAWVRAVESLIAYWTGRYEQAARLAQAGRRHRAGGSVGARLASLEARALAIVGDRVGAVAAPADAERAREAMTGKDEVPGVFTFPSAKQFAYAGTSHLAVGGRVHVQQAIVSADAAIRLYRSAEDDDQSVGDLFAAHVDLARCHLLLGDSDGTEVMLEFVFAAPPGRMSASIMRRLTALAGELGEPQYGRAVQAAYLRERLQHTAVLTAPPAAEPPEPPP